MTSALGGSVTAPKSQNATLAQSRLVLSTSKAPQPPERLCIPSIHSTPRSAAPPSSRSAAQREHDDGRVVDVGVVVVRELEREAAGGELGPAYRPVALDSNLLGGEPVGAADDRRVLRREACVEERDHGQRRVPDGRLAGLDAPPVLVVDREGVEPGERARDHRVVELVAERAQRDDRPDPRRLDPAPGAVALLPLDDPALGRPQARRRIGPTGWRP